MLFSRFPRLANSGMSRMERQACKTVGFLVINGCFCLMWFTPVQAQERKKAPLMAYVGTFSSPLEDMLPTQVDLPPGNGRGIHHFEVDRETGGLTPAGVTRSGTSPSCLVINQAGTRL